MHIHALTHVPFEGLGHIAHWIQARGHHCTTTSLYADESLPTPDQFDRLIIMGGPMNIDEEQQHPWLVRDKYFLKKTIDAGRSIIGICLGAQLLADALGASVRAGLHKEIGWFPLNLTSAGQSSSLFQGQNPSPLVFHWHGDTFDLPTNAIHLAASAGCRNQAFLAEGRFLGLQFHLEATPDAVYNLVEHCRHELVPGSFIQTEEALCSAPLQRYQAINVLMEHILDNLDT